VSVVLPFPRDWWQGQEDEQARLERERRALEQARDALELRILALEARVEALERERWHDGEG
jgi:hypothetical protein